MFELAQPIYPLLLAVSKNNPEAAHKLLIKSLNRLDRSRNQVWARLLDKELQQSFTVKDNRLEQNLWGLKFPNPLGLAPGCDKDGTAASMWASFGFGFAELGAVTLHPQPGNPPPRLFRLSQDYAVLNRMGANNPGAEVMSHTLKQAWQKQPRTIPIGINLCKSKITPLEESAADYQASFRYLYNYADFFVVNVSSPNTPGLRSLQATEQLNPILQTLQLENRDHKPIFIKISPDLDWEAIANIIDLAKTHQLAGIVATNTTISKDNLKTPNIENEAGGISGIPLQKRSTEIIRFIRQQTQGQIPIIGVGGIFTPEDAWEKIAAGACLLQVYTGWIYSGPWLVPNILKGLLTKLSQHGFSTISEAVGCDL